VVREPSLRDEHGPVTIRPPEGVGAREPDMMPEQPRDERRKWQVLIAIGMGVFLATIDASIVNVALPTLVRSFDTQFAVVQWIALSYMLTLATLILSMGRLGDLRGKKRIYTSGMIVFTVGSALCGLSPTVYWLITFRVLQAIGASMMAALGTAIVTEAFPSSERGKALGTIGGLVSIGIITGPVLGGLLIDIVSWHWIFFVNIPVGLIGTFMVLRFVPETRPVEGQRFDLAGATILFISVVAFLLALTLGQHRGFRDPLILTLFVVWLLSLGLFLYVESVRSRPMVDVRIFRNEELSLGLFSGFFAFVALAGVVLLMPFYLENVLGYSPHQVGLLLAAVPVSAGLASPISGVLSDRFGTRPMATLGLAVLLAGYVSLTTLSADTSAFGYLLRFVPVGLGIGIFQSPNNSAIMGAAARQHLGIVSGLLSITRTLGQTTGIAAIGALWSARVSFYAGADFSVGPTRTNIGAQVHGLQDALSGITLLVGLVLLLNLGGLVRRRLGVTPPPAGSRP
jgi:EmrB/QacA subfamily drug resistance transporter